MQSNPFEQSLEFQIKPSRRIAALIYAIHMGAGLCIIVSGLPWYVQHPLLVVVLVSLFRTHALVISQQNPRSIVSVLLNAGDEWWLKTGTGMTLQANLLPGAFVHPQLVLLSFKVGKQKYRVILTPDVVRPDDHRRLRVRLRHKYSLTTKPLLP